MAGSGDLYIVDSEYMSMGGKLASHRNFLSEIIEDYLKIIDYLCQNNEGQYIESLKLYAAELRELPGKIVQGGANLKSDCQQFVQRIDEADEFLY